MNKETGLTIEVTTKGVDEAVEKIGAVTAETETLADALEAFPANVVIRNNKDCVINVYPSQTKIVDNDRYIQKLEDVVERQTAALEMIGKIEI